MSWRVGLARLVETVDGIQETMGTNTKPKGGKMLEYPEMRAIADVVDMLEQGNTDEVVSKKTGTHIVGGRKSKDSMKIVIRRREGRSSATEQYRPPSYFDHSDDPKIREASDDR